MIKRIVVFFMCLVLANLVSFYSIIDTTYNKLNLLENYVNEYCISYEELEEVRVVFDYKQIDYYLDEFFIEAIKKENSKTSFTIIVEINNGFFYKTIKEEFCIRRGDMYDGGN